MYSNIFSHFKNLLENIENISEEDQNYLDAFSAISFHLTNDEYIQKILKDNPKLADQIFISLIFYAFFDQISLCSPKTTAWQHSKEMIAQSDDYTGSNILTCDPKAKNVFHHYSKIIDERTAFQKNLYQYYNNAEMTDDQCYEILEKQYGYNNFKQNHLQTTFPKIDAFEFEYSVSSIHNKYRNLSKLIKAIRSGKILKNDFTTDDIVNGIEDLERLQTDIKEDENMSWIEKAYHFANLEYSYRFETFFRIAKMATEQNVGLKKFKEGLTFYKGLKYNAKSIACKDVQTGSNKTFYIPPSRILNPFIVVEFSENTHNTNNFLNYLSIFSHDKYYNMIKDFYVAIAKLRSTGWTKVNYTTESAFSFFCKAYLGNGQHIMEQKSTLLNNNTVKASFYRQLLAL